MFDPTSFLRQTPVNHQADLVIFAKFALQTQLKRWMTLHPLFPTTGGLLVALT